MVLSLKCVMGNFLFIVFGLKRLLYCVCIRDMLRFVGSDALPRQAQSKGRCITTQFYERTTFNLKLAIPINNEKSPISSQK